MTRVLHVSDPHFGTETPEVVEALLAFAKDCAPQVVALSGDITQRARRGQFAAAKAFVDRLPAPVITVPGNHDIPLFNLWARWRSPYGNYCRAFGPSLEPELETAELLVIGVNSTRPARHKDGQIDTVQVQRVAERLSRASARQLRVVMLHHPVRAWLEDDRENVVHGRQAAMAAWSAAGADLVLGGHIHLPYILPIGVGDPQRTWAVQAGTAVSQRVRGDVPNSVNLITYDAQTRHCAVERWDYGAGGFGCFQRTAVALRRGAAQEADAARR